MRLTHSSSLAAISALLVVAAHGATRPRYGGTLRVETRPVLNTLEPASGNPASLVFEGLVRFDEAGEAQPVLAASWTHNATSKHWEFRLRPGVKFHDGYPLTPQAVGGMLQRFFTHAAVGISGDSIVIESDRPMPGLLAELAQPGALMAARGGDGSWVGTGPFRVAQWEPGKRITLAAFEEHWGGRPFLDSVTVEMGRAYRDQFLDLELGKADVVDLPPDAVRRAADRGRKIWASAPLDLVAISFPGGQAKLREALALSIDRAAIHNIILQRQGELSAALLPQWLSGYAFLFPAAADLSRARSLVAELAPSARSLQLGYDASDPLEHIIADRIALNAHDAGIAVQVVTGGRCDATLTRTRISSFDPAQALDGLAAVLKLGSSGLPAGSAGPEALYAAEKALLDSHAVIPLFHLPQTFGVSPKVRTWMTPGVAASGELRLADVWLETEKP